MAGLLGLYHLAGGAMAADNASIGVTGRNIANANTVGYGREEAARTAEPASPLYGGVRSGAATRAEDLLLANREREAAGAGGAATANASALDGLERLLSGPGADFVSALGAFFSSTTALAASPADPVVRADVVRAADTLAGRIRGAASVITSARTDSDARVDGLAGQATALAQKIAIANSAIAVSDDPTLRDERDLAASQLAAITGGTARVDPDGKMRFVLDNGAVLVDGDRAASLKATADTMLGGMRRIDVVDGTHVTDVTATVGGRMGGEVAFRDGAAVTTSTALDTFATELATQINTVNATYAGTDGIAGRAFFVPPAGVSGAAAALAVDPALLADPTRLGTAAVGLGRGDNQGAVALAALRDTAFSGGGQRTPGEEAVRMMGELGRQTHAAQLASDAASARTDALQQARESVSGVSTEEEMNRLSQFQRSHEAATRFLSTVNQLLGDLIDRI